jgi:hypothetical protein
MATTLTLEQMKGFVRENFEDFVNKRNAAVIRKNMTSDFHDHDGPGASRSDRSRCESPSRVFSLFVLSPCRLLSRNSLASRESQTRHSMCHCRDNAATFA